MKFLLIYSGMLFLSSPLSVAQDAGVDDYPYIEGQLYKEAIQPYQCKIGKEEIRLDKAPKGKLPIVRTGIIDQGQVGDCYAAAGVTLLETELNRNRPEGKEVSYVDAAIQFKSSEFEQEAEIQRVMNDSDSSKPASISEEITIDFLKKFLPEEFLNQLSKEEREELLLGFGAINKAQMKNETALDGGKICSVIKQLNKRGYCPKNLSPIEGSIEHERTKMHEPITKLNQSGDLAFLSEDRNNVQYDLVRSLQHFYLSLSALRILKDNRHHANQQKADWLIRYWEQEFYKLIGQLNPEHVDPAMIESISQCSEFTSIHQSMKDGLEDLMNVVPLIEKDYLKKVIQNLINGTGLQGYDLNTFLSSLITPDCFTPENRVAIKPAIGCHTEVFPQYPLKVKRDLTERSEIREKLWKERLTLMHAFYSDLYRQGKISNKELCSKPFLIHYGGLCNEQGNIKTLTEFIQNGLTEREKRVSKQPGYRKEFLWVTPTEYKNYQHKPGMDKSLSTRVLNASSIRQQFDEKVLQGLKNGKPVGLGVCSSVLVNNFSDGAHDEPCTNFDGTKGDNHAVVVIGVRESSGGCQYLVKDSRGTDMSYAQQRCKNYNHKVKQGLKPSQDGAAVSKDCEPGLIWIPADQLSINTYEISIIH